MQEWSVILHTQYDIRYACFPFQYSTLLNVLLTYIILLVAMVCSSGPIDCPTFSSKTSKRFGSAQFLNAFLGLSAFSYEFRSHIDTMGFIVFLVVSISIHVVSAGGEGCY